MASERLGEQSSDESRLGRVARSYAIVVLVGLLVGALIAPYAVGIATPDDTAEVAIVPVEGSIDGATATGVTEQLAAARDDPDVEAVVLLVNSPGGLATASETMYLAVQRTAKELPVVALADATAASGAYYTIAPSDHIYAKPATIVGSVGVLSTLPRDVEPNSVVAATGPNKLGSDSEREFLYRIETLQNAFVNAVMKHRGDELRIDRAELAEAGVYTGTGAVQAGIVDAIGGRDRAIRKAARLAGVEEFRVATYRMNRTATFVSRSNYLASSAENKRLVSPTYLTGLGGNGSTYGTFLMVPRQYVLPAPDDAEVTNATA